MYIEHLDGRFQGQTRDIETSAALELIKVGRAKRANFDAPAPEAPVVSSAISLPAETNKIPAHSTKANKRR